MNPQPKYKKTRRNKRQKLDAQSIHIAKGGVEEITDVVVMLCGRKRDGHIGYITPDSPFDLRTIVTCKTCLLEAGLE